MQQTPLKSPASTSRPSQEDDAEMAKKYCWSARHHPVSAKPGYAAGGSCGRALVPAMCFVLRPWQTLRATHAVILLFAAVEQAAAAARMACDAATVANKASVGVVHHSVCRRPRTSSFTRPWTSPRSAWRCRTMHGPPARTPRTSQLPGCELCASRYRHHLPRSWVAALPSAASTARPTSSRTRELLKTGADRRLRRLMMSVRLPVSLAAGPARARERRGKQAKGVIERATLSRVHKDAWLGLAYLLLVATPGRFQLD